MTCGKAQEFLARKKIEVAEVVDAKKDRLGPKDALRLARSVETIHVAKGKKVVSLDVKKGQPGDDEILALLLGPSGNLRAPTIRRGKTLLVGFDPNTYDRVLAP